MKATLFEQPTSGAIFSPDRVYRYALFRQWRDEDYWVNFLMLNPSTADEIANDPTVERCERRARSWGYAGLIVTNLFAFRSTDPSVMLSAPAPVGPDNDLTIVEHASRAALVVCAWGKDGAHMGRSTAVLELLRGVKLTALKVSEKTGEPWHPLYLSYALTPKPYERRAA